MSNIAYILETFMIWLAFRQFPEDAFPPTTCLQ
jgi:hypothetical protein